MLFVFNGLLLLRFAERQLLPSLFQLPPRFTRFQPLRPSSLLRDKKVSPQDQYTNKQKMGLTPALVKTIGVVYHFKPRQRLSQFFCGAPPHPNQGRALQGFPLAFRPCIVQPSEVFFRFCNKGIQKGGPQRFNGHERADRRGAFQHGQHPAQRLEP